MSDLILRREWGAPELPPAVRPWPSPPPSMYLHHTVTNFIEPEADPEPVEGPRRPPHLGILWTGRKPPSWAGKAKILRRYREPHIAHGGRFHGEEVPGVTRWTQMELRRRGDGGYVMVQVDPVRERQMREAAKAARATNLAGVIRVKALEERAMRQMEEYHRSLGWSAIGYRRVGFPSGRVYEGRGDRHGAHCPGANHLPSFAMAGDYAKRSVPRKLRDRVLEAARELGARKIVGHRQHPYPTGCPGVADAWLTQLNRDL